MRGCHSCVHKPAVDAGKYRDVAWEKTPCASCRWNPSSGFAVELDEARLAEEASVALAPGGGAEERLYPAEVLGQFVKGLLVLSPELRDVVAMRYAGIKYEEIARRQGVTMACVEKRHRRAMELWPALREMFAEKTAKRKRRKKAVPPRIRDKGEELAGSLDTGWGVGGE